MTKKMLFKIGTVLATTLSLTAVAAVSCSTEKVVTRVSKEDANKETSKITLDVMNRENTLASTVSDASKFLERGFDKNNWKLQIKKITVGPDRKSVIVKYVLRSKDSSVESDEKEYTISGFEEPGTKPTTFDKTKLAKLEAQVQSSLKKVIGNYKISKVNLNFDKGITEEQKKNFNNDLVKENVIDEVSLTTLKNHFFYHVRNYIAKAFVDNQLLTLDNNAFVYVIDFDKKVITGQAGDNAPVKLADITNDQIDVLRQAYITGLLDGRKEKLQVAEAAAPSEDQSVETKRQAEINKLKNEVSIIESYGERSFKEILTQKWEIKRDKNDNVEVKFYYTSTPEANDKVKADVSKFEKP